MKANRRALEAKAQESGATIEWVDDGFNVVAPDGFFWVEGSVLAIFGLIEEDGKRDAAGAYADALERMAYGLEPTEPD